MTRVCRYFLIVTVSCVYFVYDLVAAVLAAAVDEDEDDDDDDGTGGEAGAVVGESLRSDAEKASHQSSRSLRLSNLKRTGRSPISWTMSEEILDSVFTSRSCRTISGNCSKSFLYTISRRSKR